PSHAPQGGGIKAGQAANVTLLHSTVTENRTHGGHGIYEEDAKGGGISFLYGGERSTASDYRGILTINHSIVAANFSPVTFVTAPEGDPNSPPQNPPYDLTMPRIGIGSTAYAGGYASGTASMTGISDIDYKQEISGFSFLEIDFSLIGHNRSLIDTSSGYPVGYVQSSLVGGNGAPQPWEAGGKPQSDNNGNLIGGDRLGEGILNDGTHAYFGGVLNPYLDVLAYNGILIENDLATDDDDITSPWALTHAPLKDVRPLALIRPTISDYDGPTSVDSTYDHNKVVADPIVGFDAFNIASDQNYLWSSFNTAFTTTSQTLPYRFNESILTQGIRHETWQTDATSPASATFTFQLPDAELTQFVTWAGLSSISGYDGADEVREFRLEFKHNGTAVGEFFGERFSPSTEEGIKTAAYFNESWIGGQSQVFDLAEPVVADSVVMTVLNNYGGDRLTLGQVRFVGNLLDPTKAVVSPAIDAGSADAPAEFPTDQRGEVGSAHYGRKAGDAVDIGAHEAGADPPADLALRFDNQLTSIAEDTPTDEGFKVADLLISNIDNAPLQLSLSGANADLFELRADAQGRFQRELWLKPGADLDFETLYDNGVAQLDVSVSIQDGDHAISTTAKVVDLEPITVIDRNDRPVLQGEVPSITLARDVTPETNLGIAVASLLRYATDQDFLPDQDDLGIAVTSTFLGEATSSVVEYSLDGGTQWRPVELPQAGSALLLHSGARLRFNLKEEYFSGAVDSAIQFRVWDRTTGRIGRTVAISAVEESLSLATSGVDVLITPQIGNPFVVSESPVVQDQPSVAVDPRGVSIYVWRDASQGIIAQRFGPDGAALEASPIGVSLEQSAANPYVSALPDGGFLVVWEQEDPNDSNAVRLFAHRFNLDAQGITAAGNAVRLHSSTGSSPTASESLTSITLVPGDGSFVATWQGDAGVDGLSSYLGGFTINPAGVAISSFGPIALSDQAVLNQTSATTSLSLDGTTLSVAWVEGSDQIWQQDYDLSGNAIGAAQQIAQAEALESNLDAATPGARQVLDLRLDRLGADGSDLLLAWREETHWQYAPAVEGVTEQTSARVFTTQRSAGEWQPTPEPAWDAALSQDQAAGAEIRGLSTTHDAEGRVVVAWTKANYASPGSTEVSTLWYEAEATNGPYSQLVEGVWTDPVMAGNGAGQFVLVAAQLGDVAAQRYELERLNVISGVLGDSGEVVVRNENADTQKITIATQVYSGVEYLVVNGLLTDIEASQVNSLVVKGSSQDEVVDLRGLSLTGGGGIKVLAGEGSDAVYVGPGDVAVDGGGGDDVYVVSDVYATNLTLSDPSGKDTLRFSQWQGAPALLALGYDGQQQVAPNLSLTLESGDEIELVDEIDSSGAIVPATNHKVFLPSEKPADLTVTKLDADRLDVVDPTLQGLTLREAVFWAKTDKKRDAITFAPEASQAVVALSLGQIVIDSSVLIDGKDGNEKVTLQAGSDSRLLSVIESAGVTLKNLTLTGGDAAGDGGAIYAEGDLTLHKVRIAGNVASGKGGGVAFKGATADTQLQIIDSVIESNEAVYGAGLSAEAGSAHIVGSTINDNGQSPGLLDPDAIEGGGLWITGSATFTVSASTFYGNKAGYGGGVYYEPAAAAALPTLSRVTIAYNLASAGGGALWATSPVTALGTIFAGNTTGGSTVQNIQAPDGSTPIALASSSHNLVESGDVRSGLLGNPHTETGDASTVFQSSGLTIPNGGGPGYLELDESLGNPAVDKIIQPIAGISPIDQLGNVPDPIAENLDIGAIELGGMPPDTSDPSLPPTQASIREDADSGDAIVGGKVEAAPSWRFFTYEIVQGDPQGIFEIDPNSGVITIADSTPLDADLNPSYLLTVAATESTEQEQVAYGVVLVTVGGVNEAPAFSGSNEFDVLESALTGAPLGSVIATDPEGEELQYALSGGDGAFKIDAKTGLISVADRTRLQ
ncbi:MAG: cadherin domain-containing protein, partial [Planctomycetales bacterium]|nr:cadherin domain-containing protein [Planctomycetales bacterium]